MAYFSLMKSTEPLLVLLNRYLHENKNSYTKQIDFLLTEKKIILELGKSKDGEAKVQLELMAEVLRKHPQQIRSLFSVDLLSLKQILLQPNVLQFDRESDSLNNYQNDGFPEFLENYFFDDLLVYIITCVSKDAYKSLLVLTKFGHLLPERIKLVLEQNMQEKLDEGINYNEQMSLRSSEKFEGICNANFYKVLNHLGAERFDGHLITLLQTCAEKIKEQEGLVYHRVLYAASYFNSASKEMRTALENAKKIAQSLGAFESPTTGRESTNQGAIQSKHVNPELVAALKDISSGSKYGFLKWILAIVSLVGAYFGMRDKNAKPNPPMSELIDMPVTLNKSEGLGYLNATAMYVQYGDIEIVDARVIGFDQSNTNMRPPNFYGRDEELTFVNHTNQPVIALFNSGCIFLKPNESKKVSWLNNLFSIYTGQNPEMIHYIDSTGRQMLHFRFSDFDLRDSATLGCTYSFLTMTRKINYTIDISEASDSIIVELDTHGDDSIW